MADYFDPYGTYATDYLLPKTLDRDDIAYQAKQAERDVIAHYTRTETTTPLMAASMYEGDDGLEHLFDPTATRAVYLRYYKADADDVDEGNADEAAFLDAMRATIAELIEHRISQAGRTEGVSLKTQGSRTVAFAKGGRVANFPNGFERYLKPFDVRPASTYI